MRFDNVAVLGVAHVDAPHRLESRALEQRLDPAFKRLKLPSGILEMLTGIRARRLWDEHTRPSDAATLAARAALAQADIDPARVGVLICASVCRDYVEPSTACLVHGHLGLSPACLNFDLGNACLAFLNAMEVIGNMIERGQVEYGLIVDGESSRYILDKTVELLLDPGSDRELFWRSLATLTLGSGAAAMVLGRADKVPYHQGRAHRFTGSASLAATQHNHLCVGQSDGMMTDSQGLLTAGVELARQTWTQAGLELGWTPDTLDTVVMHQVSRAHTGKIVEALGLDLGRVVEIYPEFGNMGPASVPVALSKAVEQGRVGEGSRVGLMGIGSGLNCTMAEVVW